MDVGGLRHPEIHILAEELVEIVLFGNLWCHFDNVVDLLQDQGPLLLHVAVVLGRDQIFESVERHGPRVREPNDLGDLFMEQVWGDVEGIAGLRLWLCHFVLHYNVFGLRHLWVVNTLPDNFRIILIS